MKDVWIGVYVVPLRHARTLTLVLLSLDQRRPGEEPETEEPNLLPAEPNAR